MESHRLKDDEESVRAALSSLKTATGIPVTMYATLLPDNRLQITQWVGLRTPALQNLIIDSGVGVGGRVVSTRRAVGVSDYTQPPPFRTRTTASSKTRACTPSWPCPLLCSAKFAASSTLACTLQFVWVTRLSKR